MTEDYLKETCSSCTHWLAGMPVPTGALPHHGTCREQLHVVVHPVTLKALVIYALPDGDCPACSRHRARERTAPEEGP